MRSPLPCIWNENRKRGQIPRICPFLWVWIGFCSLLLFPLLLVSEVIGNEAIASMIMVGFRGTELDKNSLFAKSIQSGKIGGVILYDFDMESQSPIRNIVSRQQLVALLTQLRELAPHPLLIAIDQEGGKVVRLHASNGFFDTPSPSELGAIDSLERTREVAGNTASLLAELGIDINLAPVVDLGIEGAFVRKAGRCYGSEVEKIVRHAEAFVQEHQRRGVIPVLKHFPGLGSAMGDTHLGFVDVSGSWRSNELLPYWHLLAEVDIVMVGHAWNHHLDEKWPASLSQQVIQGLLRKEMGFRGVVITDDLQMGAIRNQYEMATVVEQALAAGVDILLFANQQVYDEEIGEKAHELIQQLATKKRIEESFARIRQLR